MVSPAFGEEIQLLWWTAALGEKTTPSPELGPVLSCPAGQESPASGVGFVEIWVLMRTAASPSCVAQENVFSLVSQAVQLGSLAMQGWLLSLVPGHCPVSRLWKDFDFVLFPLGVSLTMSHPQGIIS